MGFYPTHFGSQMREGYNVLLVVAGSLHDVPDRLHDPVHSCFRSLFSGENLVHGHTDGLVDLALRCAHAGAGVSRDGG